MFREDSNIVSLEYVLANFGVCFGREDSWYKVLYSYSFHYRIQVVGSEASDVGSILSKVW